MRLTDLLRREWGYLTEDTLSVVAYVRAKRPAITPELRSRAALLVGAVVLVLSVAQWSPPAAGVLGGVSALFYGFFLVDLDSPSTRRRKRAARRPKVTL